MTRAALLATIVLLALAGAAAARPLNADELAAYRVAAAHWGGPSGCVLEADPFAELNASGDYRGRRPGLECRIRIRDDFPFVAACTALEHEEGHAHGLAHAPAGIMALEPEVPADCDAADDVRVRALNAPLRARVRRALRRCKRRGVQRRRACLRRARRPLSHLAVTS